jgi:Tfp pilus assembly PilM family ATPase
MFSLSKTAVGLDISDHTIEIVQISKAGKSFELVGKVRGELEVGIVENGRIKNKEALTATIKELLAKAQPKKISGKKLIFGMPESQVYTHAFRLQELKKNEIEDALTGAIAKVIPLPKNDLVYDYKIRSQVKGQGSEVVIVASSKTVVGEWSNFLEGLGFGIEALDVEALANFRDLFGKSVAKPVAIADIGSVTTNVSIFDSSGLRSTHISHVAGDAIASKKSNLETIGTEIAKAINFFEKRKAEKIEELVLVGGTSQTKGIKPVIAKATGKKTRLGTSVLLKDSTGIEYLEAIGLAYRGLDSKWKDDPAIPIQKSKKTIRQRRTSQRLEKQENNSSKSESVEDVEDADENEPPETKMPTDALEKVISEQQKGNKNQLVLLAVILVIGIGFIFGAFKYRDAQDAAKAERDRQRRLESLPAQVVNKEPVDVIENDLDTPEKTTDNGLQTTDNESTDETVDRSLSTVVQRVQVIDTGVGFLNAREGAGTSFEIVKKLDIGEELGLLEEDIDSGWSKLQIEDGLEGWVATRYVEKLQKEEPVDESLGEALE